MYLVSKNILSRLVFMTRYKQNFLADVIFRIDFASLVELGESEISPSFEEKILEIYPIKEPIPQVNFKLENDNGNFVSTKYDETLWTYKNNDRSIAVELKPDCLVLNLKKGYLDFADFHSKITFILTALFSAYEIPQIQRMGLRYIDKILLPEDLALFDWTEYLSLDLIKNLDFIEDKNQLRRTMQVFELTLGSDINVSFKCGVFNSWFPDRLLQKEFVIDTDCYSPIVFQKNEIDDKLLAFNKICTDFFEKTITEEFRTKILNA